MNAQEFHDRAFLSAYSGASCRILDPNEAAKVANKFADAAVKLRKELDDAAVKLRKELDAAPAILPPPKTVDLATKDLKPRGRPRKKKE